MAIKQEDLEDLNEEELEDRGDDFESEDEEDEEDSNTDENEDSDEDEESEEDQEDQDDESDEDEEPSPKKEIKIPKSRLDEVIQQREDAKERNLWLEEQLSILIKQSQKESTKEEKEIPASTYNFEEAEENYVSLIIEGEIIKASKLRAEIDKQRKEEFLSLIKSVEKDVANKNKTETSLAFEEDRFNKFIDKVESEYSFLNDKNDDYNEEAVDTVNTLLAGYVAAGKTKTEGLKLAVSKVVPMYVKVPVEKKSLGNKRTVEAGKKAAKAANSQPTKVKSASASAVDSSKINISKMSDRDFGKLTEKEKRILRGD